MKRRPQGSVRKEKRSLSLPSKASDKIGERFQLTTKNLRDKTDEELNEIFKTRNFINYRVANGDIHVNMRMSKTDMLAIQTEYSRRKQLAPEINFNQQ